MGNKPERIRVDPETNRGLIIERVNLLSRLTVFSQWSYNAFAWFCWIFLLRPLLIAGLWYLGFKMTYFQMIELEGFHNPEFFRWLIIALCLIFLFMLFWNRYNAYRFRGKDRRRSRGECDSVDMAAYYKVSPDTIDRLKQAANLDFYFGPESVSIDDGTGSRIQALYAPQNLQKHLGDPSIPAWDNAADASETKVSDQVSGEKPRKL